MIRVKIDGLEPDEVRELEQLLRACDQREAVCLKLAVRMAEEGEMGGARWMVRKLIARRRTRR